MVSAVTLVALNQATLPLNAAFPIAGKAEKSPLVQRQVLIADDNSVVRGIVKSFLTRRRDLAVCAEAANGREAVEKTRALKPDLVLLDLVMPEMNGVEVASVLKQSMPEIPIVLFTMYSENLGAYLTNAIGVAAVLSKPDGLTKLAKVVDILLPRDPEPTEAL